MRILKVIGLLLEYPDELLWENRDDALAAQRNALQAAFCSQDDKQSLVPLLV